MSQAPTTAGTRSTRTAREVAELTHQMVQGIGDVEFADLFAADGVLEYPFAVPGMPDRLEGREAIRAFYARAANARGLFTMEDSSISIHETADPAVVIVEIEHHGTSHVTDRPYRNVAVGVIRVQGGEIVSYRDYMNPLTVAELTGRSLDPAPDPA